MDDQGFDYIVIGAGSAGCVVARRLSDQPDCRVLLLEAGPPANNFWISTPAGMAKLFRNPRYNWGFQTEPEPNLRNRRIYWPRGKTLGGSSAINGMAHCRGNAGDFDHWAQLGNTGWTWDDVLPYFKRSETNSRGANQFHGGDGPLYVGEPAVMHPTVVDFIEASANAGVPKVETFNGSEHEGVGVMQCNIKNGKRQSTYVAYLAPVRNRPNLVIRTGVHVRKILLDGRVATGVEVVEGGAVRSYFARREVVLCGGALSSPQTLMLSGIGNAEHLREHGIEPVVDLPGVGQNLQDHFVLRVQAKVTEGSSYNHELLGWRKYWHGFRYLMTGGGYLAQSSSQVAAFVKSRPDLEYADLEMSFRPMTYSMPETGDAVVDTYSGIGASVYRVRPASRGEVLLRSADPMDSPRFIPNFLSEKEDVDAMISGMRQLRKILATEPLAKRVTFELLPGQDVQTDEQLIDYMEKNGGCAFHPASTCKMGIDPMAVVDARLRVHGVERLRVVDASIMPTVTSGNTNAPIVMIAEKAADMILADKMPARVAA